MRTSQLFAPTLREVPAEAEIASHRLLLRGAFIRKLAAGIYTTLPRMREPTGRLTLTPQPVAEKLPPEATE